MLGSFSLKNSSLNSSSSSSTSCLHFAINSSSVVLMTCQLGVMTNVREAQKKCENTQVRLHFAINSSSVVLTCCRKCERMGGTQGSRVRALQGCVVRISRMRICLVSTHTLSGNIVNNWCSTPLPPYTKPTPHTP